MSSHPRMKKGRSGTLDERMKTLLSAVGLSLLAAQPLAPQSTGLAKGVVEENRHVLSQEQMDAAFTKPGCLDGYRPSQSGPLIPLDRGDGEPLDTTFTVEPRWIDSDGFRIRGWLYLPKAEGPFPLVVLTNGGGGDRSPTKSLSDFIAPVFAHCGVAAFVHDKRGTGESDGVFRDTTYEDYIRDTGNSAVALSEDPRIDPDRIGVMGGSEGGRIAVSSASRFPVFSFAISMMGPLQSMKEDRFYAQLNGLRVQGSSDSLLAQVEPIWRGIIDAWASDDPAQHARIDEEILAAQKLLTSREGIFCEPASATSVAGALRDIRSGRIPEGSSVVCTLTGHGLKDPDTAIKQCEGGMLTVDAELDAVKAAILNNM